MKQKKWTALLLAGAMVLALASCGGKPEPTPTPEGQGEAGLYTPGTYSGSSEGRNGPLEVSVTFDANAITAVVVTSHTETASISDPAIEKIPSAIVAGQTLAVDVIAGATITSDAILAAVADAVTKAGGDPSKLQTAASNDNKEVEKVELSADVVIVGAGSAGSVASLRLAQQGRSVILLEKMDFIGGSSAACGGMRAGMCSAVVSSQYFPS